MYDVTLEFAGQIVKLSSYDKPAQLGVSITKRANKSVLAGQQMKYIVTVANTSNVALDNFFLHDRLPTDVSVGTVLTTGTYNARLNYYVCANYPRCDSYVSAHRGSRLPMGTLADGQLRGLRRGAHQAFNRLWKDRYMSIDEAYRWLQLKLGIPKSEAHIANFSEYRCNEVIRLCQEFTSSVQTAKNRVERKETAK